MTPLTHPALAELPGIAHGFFTRQGGVSGGIYASLNCGVGSKDDRAAVAENRRRVAASMGGAPEKLATPFQVHGDATVRSDGGWQAAERPRADAVVTTRPGTVVAVGTADCGPLLLADAGARVVAAAHAGWKGARSGIAESALAAMEAAGADRSRIVAVLGPTISQANYEVGADLIERFEADDPGNARWFRPSARPGHALFDLPGYIVARLARAGVDKAYSVDRCTYADDELFFSYRRATHRGEPDYGRMLAAIVIR